MFVVERRHMQGSVRFLTALHGRRITSQTVVLSLVIDRADASKLETAG